MGVDPGRGGDSCTSIYIYYDISSVVVVLATSVCARRRPLQRNWGAQSELRILPQAEAKKASGSRGLDGRRAVSFVKAPHRRVRQQKTGLRRQQSPSGPPTAFRRVKLVHVPITLGWIPSTPGVPGLDDGQPAEGPIRMAIEEPPAAIGWPPHPTSGGDSMVRNDGTIGSPKTEYDLPSGKYVGRVYVSSSGAGPAPTEPPMASGSNWFRRRVHVRHNCSARTASS